MVGPHYTGVGSRETPDFTQRLMTQIAYLLEPYFVLRSGGAPGADSAFEAGVTLSHRKEIYLPWPRFNGNESKLHDVSSEAIQLASMHHVNWKAVQKRQAAMKLHGRNVYQVLGLDLRTPSSFVLCWTVDGKATGGTATAINIAKSRNIPVINMATAYKRDLTTLLPQNIAELLNRTLEWP